MAPPTITKTWNWTSNQSIAYVSAQQMGKDILYLLKTKIAAMPGATIKGSSVGATSSMDAVDRWTSAAALGNFVSGRATTGCTWIVFTLANMDNIEFMIALVDGNASTAGARCLLAISTSAGFTVSSTVTPAATDEYSNMEFWGNSYFTAWNTTGTRVVSTAYASDGSEFRMIVFRAGFNDSILIVQKPTLMISAPASSSQYVMIHAGDTDAINQNFTINDIWSGNSQTWKTVMRLDNGVGSGSVPASLHLGYEAYANTWSAYARLTFVPELQGGGGLFTEMSLWSETGVVRGKVGALVDVWMGYQSATVGDTYPNDATRTHIQLGFIAIPWDGSVPVLS